MHSLRWLIVAISLIYLVVKLQKSNLNDFELLLSKMQEDWPGYVFVALLATVNWYLESLKWKYSIRPLASLSALSAYQSVLAGVGVSMFTPNRSGEFLGRWFWLQEDIRPYAIPASLVGSMSQLFITLMVGSLSWTLSSMTSTGQMFHFLLPVLFSLGVMLLMLLLIFRIDLLIPWIKLYLRKLDLLPYFEFVMNIPVQVKWKIFGWSAMRYAVFATQFALVCQFLSGQPYWRFYSSLANVYFVQTIVPSFAFAELGVRGSAALNFMGQLAPNEALVMATGFIWMVNLLIPSVVGSILLAMKRRI